MRYKVVYITGYILQVMLTEGMHPTPYKVLNGVPVSSRFEYSFPSATHAGIGLVFSNSDWEELKPGDEIPTLEIWMEKIEG